MRTRTSLACSLLLTLLASSADAFVIAYDDASDSAYDSGWLNLSNGGYGFGSWTHGFWATHSMGDSNQNGSLGGPGINVGGRAWQAEFIPTAQGAIVGRGLGAYAIGDSFTIDVDFGSVSEPGQGVAILGGSDFCQVQAVSSSANLLINTGSGSLATGIAYNDGGFRVRYDLLSATALDVTITSFATNQTQTLNLAFNAGTGNYFMTLQSNNPISGQAIYASRMQIDSPVPEPATLAAMGLGLAGLARRRRK